MYRKHTSRIPFRATVVVSFRNAIQETETLFTKARKPILLLFFSLAFRFFFHHSSLIITIFAFRSEPYTSEKGP